MSDGEFDQYPLIEVTPNAQRSATGDVDPRLLEALDAPYCVQLSALHICLADWSNDRITVEFLLYGVRIAKATLKASDPCIKVREGGDLAKVKVDVCADFAKRAVTAKGEVCVTFACVKFNQVIFNW